MLCRRTACHLLPACLRGLKALGFGIGIQCCPFIGTGRAEQQPVGEEPPAVRTGEAPKSEQKPDAAKLEKSLAVLARLRELEFHSRANIEKLAELSLTIEEELKQKAFVEPIGDVYFAQEAFHSKISALIEGYQVECDRLRPAG